MIRRLLFLIPAGVALLAGLDSALLLLSLPAPVTTARLPDVHGMVMVLGFVGTVIALERAVALRKRAGFISPALLGLGGLLLISPAPLRLGQLALVCGSAGLMGIYVPLWRRTHDDSILVQAFGAVLATGATLLWLGGTSMALLLPWLAGFVVLTIAGERLELARVAQLTVTSVGQFVTISALITLGTVLTLLTPSIGFRILGLSYLALVGWLVLHDVARHTIRATGLTRFMAGCLLSAYFWLAVAGAIWVLAGAVIDGPLYDSLIHAIFLGFTMSMIMAHAPVILPAVLRVRLPYHPVMIIPPVLLHLSLLLRIGVGNAGNINVCRQVGGVLNVIALLSFAIIAAGVVIHARRQSSTSPTKVGPG